MVVRVWGKADSYELAFSSLDSTGEAWSALVPADLDDGQYAVELYAIDDSGNMAYWTGMLYLNKSECVQVQIVEDKFKLWMIADVEVIMQDESHIWLEDEQVILKMTVLDYVGGG